MPMEARFPITKAKDKNLQSPNHNSAYAGSISAKTSLD